VGAAALGAALPAAEATGVDKAPAVAIALAAGATLAAPVVLEGDAALEQAAAANETATTKASHGGRVPRRMNGCLCMPCLLLDTRT